MPLLAKQYCDLFKLLSLLHNLPLKYDTLMNPNNLYDYITLSLTASIKLSCPILTELKYVDTSKYLLHLLVPFTGEKFHAIVCQTYIILYQALNKYIPNAILRPETSPAYNTLQQVIMEYYGRKMLKHIYVLVSF